MNGSERSMIRAIRGPITLITVGVLFAFNNFTPYSFSQTWPVLLIVFGLLSLLRRGTEQPMPPQPGGTVFPPYSYPPPPGGYPPPAGPGSFRQSSYTETTPPPPAGTAKGGFGSSAPSKPSDTAQPPSGESI